MSIVRWLFPRATEQGDTTPAVRRRTQDDDKDWAFAPPAEAPAVALPTVQEMLTETAAIIIYDMEALAHRLDDDLDWWADPELELDELRNRNLLILGVQADGFYDVEVKEGEAEYPLKFSLRAPSGKMFIGPGEVITGGGGHPTGNEGGFFISLEPGDYIVAVQRITDERISLALSRGAAFKNPVSEPVSI